MKKLAVAFALILTSFALVACGSDSSDDTSGETTATTTESAEADGKANPDEAQGGSAGSGSVVDFEADPDGGLAYTSDSASAKAGKVTIDFTNPQPLTHDVAIEDSGGETIARTELISESSDSTVADLKAGEYTFYCSVPGHREAGMEGTLTAE